MRRTTKLSIILLVLLLAIGFAAIATTLIINGTVSVGSNPDDFKVIFTSASTDRGGTVEISENLTEITYSTKMLKNVGDVAVLNYTVTNDSANYDANVTVDWEVTNTVNGKDYSSYYEVSRTGFDTDAATLVEAKASQNGTIEITLVKPALDDVQLSFTMTLNANAVERTVLGEGIDENRYTPFWSSENGDEYFTINTSASSYGVYWDIFDDYDDGGNSSITWPVSKGTVEDEDSLVPIIEHCDGLCGTANIDKGTMDYYGFAGVEFTESWWEDETMDLTNIGGLCITYTSDTSSVLELSMGDEVDSTIGYALPNVILPASTTEDKTKCFEWSDFKQPSWYQGNNKISGTQAATQLKSVRFKIQADNGSYNFNIKSVGPYMGISYFGESEPTNYGELTVEHPIFLGNSGYERVITGKDNGTNTSGYFYLENDSSDGGNSTVTWPIERADLNSNYLVNHIVAECKGICGTAVLDQGTLMYNPFVNIGFNIAGKSHVTNKYEPVDVSDWGGICIKYTSSAPPTLELDLGEDINASIGYANPNASLPKSSAGAIKCIRWSQFRQPGWYKGDIKISGEQAATQLVGIKFKIQWMTGSYDFNIQQIGTYN